MGKKTISEIYSEWKSVKRKLVKQSTFATYVIHAEKHVPPVLGSRDNITADDVQMFAFGMLGSGLSVRTVREVLIVLKMIVSFGLRAGWTGWHGGGIVLPKDAAAGGVALLSDGEQRRFMQYLKTHDTFRNVGLYLCLCTGLRIGELCAMTWADVNFDACVVKVSRTLERIYVVEDGRRFTKLVIGPPKTLSSCREIPVSGTALSLLTSAFSRSLPGGFLLTGTGKPLEPRLYRRYYVRLMARLGLPAVKFHGLRHTFATRCIESGCDYKTVSALLGHSSVSTTLNLYVHPGMSQKRKCIDLMLRSVCD